MTTDSILERKQKQVLGEIVYSAKSIGNRYAKNTSPRKKLDKTSRKSHLRGISASGQRLIDIKAELDHGQWLPLHNLTLRAKCKNGNF